MHENAGVPLLQLICKTEELVRQLRKTGTVTIDGQSLDIAAVVAVARHGCIPVAERSENTNGLSNSIKVIEDSFQQGDTLYGVNTGFGGSADVRTENRPALEKSLMQTLQSAVLVDGDRTGTFDPLDGLSSHSMPLPWVKGTMAGISRTAIDAVVSLLEHRITPVIPLRGSISASGDLMPLSYVAGTLEGSPDIFVHLQNGETPCYTTAQAALESCGLLPRVLGPRDGLALVNGTAASAAVASLALFDAGQLAVLSAVLTALTAEAMSARIDWLHPFVHDIRPHPGQIEASDVMRAFLLNSRLVDGLSGTAKSEGSLVERFDGALAQDRYPLRTSPQWIGPQLEDLLHAHSQIAIELNSTSDNPVTDPRHGEVYCGGNFQAASVTSAVEKIRLGLQNIGKMVFSQCTEIINQKMSNGLPANLATDDPSASFCLKGLDINMAAYQSELAFLANPVSNHVQSAEMHNQAINSIALLSARYTFQSVELVGLMIASALYAACQAVDLRVMHALFLQSLSAPLAEICASAVASLQPASFETALSTATRSMRKTWWATASLDAADRCDQASWAFVYALAGLDQSSNSPGSVITPLNTSDIHSLHSNIKGTILDLYTSHRITFLQQPETVEYLGSGTGRIYTYVRHELGVPMHHGLVDHPTPEHSQGKSGAKKTIGSQVAIIYQAVRDGRLFAAVSGAVADLGLCEK